MNDTLKDAIALTIMTAVLLLGAGIYFFTLYLAYLTSFGSLLLTLFIPVLGQLYWLWIVWGTTGPICAHSPIGTFGAVAASVRRA